jgi:AP-3 complex subunit delta-1
VVTGLSEHTVLVRVAVEKLREFIDEPDPNLKYLGLQALQELRLSHPRAVAEHKETIFACLQEGDYTIQACALSLVRGMVNRRNLHDTVLHLMLTMRRAEQVSAAG